MNKHQLVEAYYKLFQYYTGLNYNYICLSYPILFISDFEYTNDMIHFGSYIFHKNDSKIILNYQDNNYDLTDEPSDQLNNILYNFAIEHIPQSYFENTLLKIFHNQ